MIYGMQPTYYVALWKRFYIAVKKVAPSVAMCWAPNMGHGYPFGQGRYGLLDSDFALLGISLLLTPRHKQGRSFRLQ